MVVIPWNRFHFIGYVIGVSIAFFIVLMDTLIFFCTMTGLLPIFVRSWQYKVRVYSILMTILGVTFILFGILTITDKKTDEGILSYMTVMWQDRDVANSMKAEADTFWNDVQMEYECCGLNYFYDYDFNDRPPSCCERGVKTCTQDNSYETYCYNAVKGYHGHVLVISVATVAFTSALICLILIILAQFSKHICGLQNEAENVSVL